MSTLEPVLRTWYAYTADRAYLDGAAYLGVTSRQLKRLVANRRIGFTRLGQRTVFSREQLDSYLATNTFDVASEQR